MKPIDLFKAVIQERNKILIIYYKGMNVCRNKKTYSEASMFDYRESIRDIYKAYGNHNIYRECKDIFHYLNDFCDIHKLEWDLVENRIVVHYPKIIIKNHTITDIWLRIPVWFLYRKNIQFRRTSYTAKEIKCRFCHPHISADSNYEWSDEFCMGSTRFSCFSEQPSLNVLSLLYYLNDFLTHEHYVNPYVSTSSVNKINSNYPVVRRIYEYDINKIDIKYTSINNNIVISPDLTEKTVEYLTEKYADTLIWELNGNVYSVNELVHVENPPLPREFTFKGRTIQNVITDMSLDEKDAIINPFFYNNWSNHVTKELTKQFKEYVETIRSDKRESIGEMQVSMQ